MHPQQQHPQQQRQALSSRWLHKCVA
jgi:hypothetical protein